jgi:beta-galactosidase
VPAAMLDGNLATGWSNFYRKAPTALLPAFSLAHARDWVSLALPSTQRLTTVTATFTTDASRSLPAAIAVSAWNGRAWVPVGHPLIAWQTASNQPTTITFDPVTTTRIRLDLTSAFPKAPNGFLQIAELRASG